MTHCNVLPLLSDCKPLNVTLKQRFCKFYESIDKHGSEFLKGIVNCARNNPLSNFCENYINITRECHTDILKCYNHLNKKWLADVPDELMYNVGVLREMIDIRDGVKKCEILSIDEVLCIIEDISVY